MKDGKLINVLYNWKNTFLKEIKFKKNPIKFLKNLMMNK